jgi:tetratricopeptide (TPR) repeat protein
MDNKKKTSNSEINTQAKPLKGKRKVVFYLILVLIPVILVVLFELALRVVDYGYNLDLFVQSKSNPDYYEVNQKVAKRFFTKFDGTSPSNDIFLIKKPENCYRIFVMGCSSTRGFPYGMGVTFSRILNYRLQDAFPNKKIEVVNTAMAAVNSFTQADFIDEILAMKPDAILIYTGHNEFYGALGVGSVENGGNAVWIKRLHLALIQYRVYQLVQNVLGRITRVFVKDNSRATGTLMERIVKDKAIPYGSELYKSGIQQFRVNMDKVVEKIYEAKVPLIFSEVVSNLSGNAPFHSCEIAGYPTAIEVFQNAKKLETEGKFDEARKLFYLAKDLDGIRFRASEDINVAIREISKKYNVPTLNMREVFEKVSPNGIIGDNIMTEHLHPNVNGYFLMADAFFNEMMKNRFVSEKWDTTLIKPAEYYRSNWGFTPLDSLVADLTIKKLKSGWPFKPDSVVNQFKFTYKPTSVIDSIAFMCVKFANVSTDEKHRELINAYIKIGDKQKAFNEYFSLIKSTPYNVELYYEALKLLMDLNDYKKALYLLNSMPNKEKVFFVNLQIGKIHQNLNEHKLALQSFEHAKSIITKDDNLEFLLVSEFNSYNALHDSVMMTKLVHEIRQVNPNFAPGDAKKKEVVVYIDKEVKDLVLEALALARQKNYTEAIKLLEKSLKIKESAFALKMMGSILYMQSDSRALSFLERANKSEPGDLNVLSNLMVLYLNKKDYKMALQMLSEYKNISTDFGMVQRLTDLVNKEIAKNK